MWKKLGNNLEISTFKLQFDSLSAKELLFAIQTEDGFSLKDNYYFLEGDGHALTFTNKDNTYNIRIAKYSDDSTLYLLKEVSHFYEDIRDYHRTIWYGKERDDVEESKI